MNFNKSYSLTAGNHQITYGYSLNTKKWEFKYNNQTLLVALRGGHNKAKKIANIISGALKRRGELDNLARANINIAAF